MSPRRRHKLLGSLVLATAILCTTACESYFFLPGFGNGSAFSGGTLILGDPFTEVLVQGRIFTHGKSVTAITYALSDPERIPLALDFNGDGKTDPVVGYEHDNDLSKGGVVQILLSDGPVGTVDFISLTLDGNGRWKDLLDVAVGDIDNDGQPDIVAATSEGVVYLHHPPLSAAASQQDRTTLLRAWGNADPDLEFVGASTDMLTTEDIENILADAAPPAFNIDDWDIVAAQGYTNVEIADFNADGDNDIVAAQYFRLNATPKSGTSGEAFEVSFGELQIFLNPGGPAGAVSTGEFWTTMVVGRHERYLEPDREGAEGLLVCDLDGDGDLDLLSASMHDENVQIAWFEHPGVIDPSSSLETWTPWRVGSVRGAFAVDVGDVTGDGRPDVVASAGAQMQLMLFEQPADGPQREYDWDAYPLVTFESFEPRDVKLLDVDDDGVLEMIVGGTNGAVRYFQRSLDPRDVWDGFIITTFDDGGTVSLLGYGDLDGDDDLDLVATVDTDEDNQSRTVWIRNDLAN